jgi:hypothetical protein
MVPAKGELAMGIFKASASLSFESLPQPLAQHVAKKAKLHFIEFIGTPWLARIQAHPDSQR